MDEQEERLKLQMELVRSHVRGVLMLRLIVGALVAVILGVTWAKQMELQDRSLDALDRIQAQSALTYVH